MGRRGPKKAKVAPGEVTDPAGLWPLALGYLEWMRVRHYSERTVRNREYYLGRFVAWCRERGVLRAEEVTRPVLEHYQRWLYARRGREGKPLSARSQHARLVPVREYFKWLARTRRLAYNPASELELPRMGEQLPRAVLTAEEAEAILAEPDVTTALGLRDRVMMEVLYSTGIRRAELAGLRVTDVEYSRGTVMVREGKGKKDRVVPIGERALLWVEKYTREARHRLTSVVDEGHLFVTNEGRDLLPGYLTHLIAQYVTRAGIGKRGSCHLFRHTCATLMLEGGADIRFIQQMLGHAELSTTQIYTRVSITKLKAVHEATHPARMTRKDRGA